MVQMFSMCVMKLFVYLFNPKLINSYYLIIFYYVIIDIILQIEKLRQRNKAFEFKNRIYKYFMNKHNSSALIHCYHYNNSSQNYSVRSKHIR